MQIQNAPDFENFINRNPSVDSAMLGILNGIVGGESREFLDEARIIKRLEKLSDIFKLTTQVYDKCVKFEQSDVFLYIEKGEEIYAAYMDFDTEDSVWMSKKRMSHKSREGADRIQKRWNNR